MPDSEKPDVGCGQVHSVRTLERGVEARRQRKMGPFPRSGLLGEG
jgi:hypothetical protein